jgi:hypothetical protein
MRQDEPAGTLIDPEYLPFSDEELLPHFTGDGEARVARFKQSAARYRRFLSENVERMGLSMRLSRLPCQVEKDETFWTATALKHLIDSPDCRIRLATLLSGAFGPTPPFRQLASWEECLTGQLQLILEAALPSPRSYVQWLATNHRGQHFIPYVLHAARSTTARELEGSTHVDAIVVNIDNGFSLHVEAKVLSDISATVTFDVFRNQLVRNIDVMLEAYGKLELPFSRRDPALSLLALLTPRAFRDRPQSRLYGWLYGEYKKTPSAMGRDLPHRLEQEWPAVAERLGWLSFEDIESVLPGACPWSKRLT